MITPSNASSVQQNTRQASDGLLQTADKAIDATRGYANQMLDVADEKMHALQSKVEPALDRFAAKAQDLAQRGMDMAGHTKDQAKESLSHYSAATTRYVAEKPVQSVLIAAAVGAAVALLVSSASHRHSR
jgi:ElaB/YqjD/DUF883 family membrane-anchored ribosome-binding protein